MPADSASLEVPWDEPETQRPAPISPHLERVLQFVEELESQRHRGYFKRLYTCTLAFLGCCDGRQPEALLPRRLDQTLNGDREQIMTVLPRFPSGDE